RDRRHVEAAVRAGGARRGPRGGRRRVPRHEDAERARRRVQRAREQRGGDLRALLALRRSHLDPRVHLRVSHLGETMAHTAEELAHEHRRYLQVFAWLAILTALELAVIYMPIPRLAIGAM